MTKIIEITQDTQIVTDLEMFDILWRYIFVNIKLFEMTYEQPIIYGAYLWSNKKFKVYWADGNRYNPENITKQGSKLRSEAAARALFPQLKDFEFIVS